MRMHAHSVAWASNMLLVIPHFTIREDDEIEYIFAFAAPASSSATRLLPEMSIVAARLFPDNLK